LNSRVREDGPVRRLEEMHVLGKGLTKDPGLERVVTC
jgi:hypothetical protein